jgi:predicted NUDIX family NTP pyrophosphohydrolase
LPATLAILFAGFRLRLGFSHACRRKAAMPKRSAGILMVRRGRNGLEFLLVHPGGPFWAKKDRGVWSIPKGEYVEPEDPLTVAIREFEEETGLGPQGDFAPLGEIVQPGRKVVVAWAVEGDFDPAKLKSNMFELEWPPRSGRRQAFPEVDRADWFSFDTANEKILPAQRPLLARALETLSA